MIRISDTCTNRDEVARIKKVADIPGSPPTVLSKVSSLPPASHTNAL